MATGRRSALLISTSSYEDLTFRQLQAPTADVNGLQNVLSNPAIGNYAVQLLNDTPSHQVNQEIEGFFAEAGLDDLVLLYFSGHGFKDDEGRLYLVTSDSRRQLLGSTAVSAQFVRDQLERCRSRRKIVILDCCYAGAFPVGPYKGADNIDVLSRLGGRGSAVITASSAIEYAFEGSDAGLVSSTGSIITSSVFTNALIEGIATGKADLNGDGIIDIDELYEHVYQQVKSVLPQQTPGRRSDLEGTLFVAASPQGPRPVPLPAEIEQGLRSPLASQRRAIIEDLLTFCSDTHPGTVMTVHKALIKLARDDSNMVASAARVAIAQIDNPATRGQDLDLDIAYDQLSAEQLSAAEREADSIRTTARSEADELTSTTEREVAKLRATADHEVAEKRAATERDIAKLRTITEREVAQLKAAAKRQRDEILTTSKRQADEMRSQAQLILEESEALRAQAEAEFEIQLAARREEAERQEAERLAAAQTATQRLVSEAEQSALAAVQRESIANTHLKQALAEAEYLLKFADQLSAMGYRLDELSIHRERISGYLAKAREVAEKLHLPQGAPQNQPPEFEKVMRGYEPYSVDDFIARLARNPNLATPEFPKVMRGYSPTEVDRYIASLRRAHE